MLNDQKVPLQSISSTVGICRQTAPIWLSNWEEQGLTDKPRAGSPPKLSSAQEIEIIMETGAKKGNGLNLCLA
ncbi:MAG: hypothetical protein GQ529_06070 [Methyloprofundus sp.]|nr:hypothetical protein [Methyloprofundus sp.]